MLHLPCFQVLFSLPSAIGLQMQIVGICNLIAFRIISQISELSRLLKNLWIYFVKKTFKYANFIDNSFIPPRLMPVFCFWRIKWEYVERLQLIATIAIKMQKSLKTFVFRDFLYLCSLFEPAYRNPPLLPGISRERG